MKIILNKLSNHIFLSLFFGGLIAAAFFPLTLRSVWIDEVYLFNNYPINDIYNFLAPLPFYDQAATPIYSLIASTVSLLNTQFIRLFFLFFIVSSAIYTLCSKSSFVYSYLVAALSVAVLFFPLYMFSELKHYGLEFIGVLIAAMWFSKKNIESEIKQKDAALLLGAMLCGISTLIVTSIILTAFVLEKKLRHIKLNKLELVIVFFAYIAIGLYYILIKHVSHIQINNYLDVYQSQGLLNNIKSLYYSFLDVFEYKNNRLIFLFLALNILIINAASFRSQEVKKVFFISVVIFFVICVLSGINIYPVRNSRHIVWMTGIFSVSIYLCLNELISSGGLKKYIGIFVMINLTALGGININRAWNDTVEHTENKQAIEYINQLPASDIGVWGGGQAVIEYYMKTMPELGKHRYFGKINSESAPVAYSDINNLKLEELTARSHERGAHGRTGIFRIKLDYQWPARQLLKLAPKNKSFYIFASHYYVNAKDGYNKAKVDALNQAFMENNCEYSIANAYKNVVIYKSYCPS